MDDQVRVRVCDAIEKRVGVSCRNNNRRTCFAGLGKIVGGGKQPFECLRCQSNRGCVNHVHVIKLCMHNT